jgi:hypothetical protein
MVKGKRGFKFTAGELESLAKTIEELVPISTTEWEWFWNQHNTCYPKQEQTLESLKCKFQEEARAKVKTSDPNMPSHICVAKRAYYAIVKKTDGSTGGGSKDSIFGVRSDDEGEGGEQEGGGGGDGDEDNELDFDNDNIGCDQGDGTSLGVDPTNLFGDVVDVEGVNGALFGDDAGADEPVAVAATVSTAASSSTMSTNSGGKRSSGASAGGGGKQKKTKAFTQPLRIPRKSPSNTCDDGEDGYSFGNMMYMMMIQSRMDN